MKVYQLLLFLVFLFFLAILSYEPFHPSGGVNQFLLASEKRMTSRTDFDMDILDRGTCVYDVSTGTGDGGFEILRMNFFLHEERLLHSVRKYNIHKDKSKRKVRGFCVIAGDIRQCRL